jgi:hypothetical protein
MLLQDTRCVLRLLERRRSSMWSRGLPRNADVEHELCDEHAEHVLWGVGVQRGHLRVEHELCDVHAANV